MKNLEETIDEYLEQNKIRCFEGRRGTKNIEKLLIDMGYDAGEYFDDAIRNFLCDNSGATEALIDWIKSREIPEWQENLESCLEEKPEEDEE